MVIPEKAPSKLANERTEARAILTKQLELADEIENPLERFFIREQLLEQFEELEDLNPRPDPSWLS